MSDTKNTKSVKTIKISAGYKPENITNKNKRNAKKKENHLTEISHTKPKKEKKITSKDKKVLDNNIQNEDTKMPNNETITKSNF